MGSPASSVPEALTGLTELILENNQLTEVDLPSNLAGLAVLNLSFNRLATCSLPPGLTNLTTLILGDNKLTNLTLPRDMTELTWLVLDGNPLTTLVLSEVLAKAALAETVISLKEQGVSVFTYPLAIQLIRPRQPIGAFQFAILGPPGAYTVLGSPNMADWNELGVSTNRLGSIVFTDVLAHLAPNKFYSVRYAPDPAVTDAPAALRTRSAP